MKGNINLVEAVVRGCSVKMMCLEFSQNSQENNCAVIELHAGIDIFKTKETSRAAIIFLTKFSSILKTRRQCKEYLEVIPLLHYCNALLHLTIWLIMPNCRTRQMHQISG